MTVTGVLHVVGFGNTPVPVDDSEMAALQAVAASGLLAQPFPFLRVGQTVRLEEGPLRNIEGILTEIQGAQHLLVSVSLLQRSVAVRVERKWARPVMKQLRLFGGRAGPFLIRATYSINAFRMHGSFAAGRDSLREISMTAKRKTRMISFRVSDTEFDRLRTTAEAKGARSISDYAREALCGSASGSGEELDSGLRRLSGDMRQLSRDIQSA